MIEQQAAPGVAETAAPGATGSGGTAFNQWLRAQLKARRLTQRQLAHKSGVNNSTISRLMRGEQTPSLRTATLLAGGLGMAGGLDWPDRQSLDVTASPPARVEHALRLDDVLGETQVREIMQVYLMARLGRRSGIPTGRSAGTSAPGEAPKVSQIPQQRDPAS